MRQVFSIGGRIFTKSVRIVLLCLLGHGLGMAEDCVSTAPTNVEHGREHCRADARAHWLNYMALQRETEQMLQIPAAQSEEGMNPIQQELISPNCVTDQSHVESCSAAIPLGRSAELEPYDLR